MKTDSAEPRALDRRAFLKQAGLALPAAPIWSGIVPESLGAKIPESIKITDLKSLIVEDEVYLKIFTDAGVIGEGHTAVHRKAPTCKAAVDDLARVLVGQDPTRIEFLWQAMYRWPRWRRPGVERGYQRRGPRSLGHSR